MIATTNVADGTVTGDLVVTVVRTRDVVSPPTTVEEMQDGATEGSENGALLLLRRESPLPI